MGTTTHFDHHADETATTSVWATVSGAAMIVPHFFAALGNAYAASREFERLSHMSDTQLAARGMTRDDIGHNIVSRYLDA